LSAVGTSRRHRIRVSRPQPANDASAGLPNDNWSPRLAAVRWTSEWTSDRPWDRTRRTHRWTDDRDNNVRGLRACIAPHSFRMRSRCSSEGLLDRDGHDVFELPTNSISAAAGSRLLSLHRRSPGPTVVTSSLHSFTSRPVRSCLAAKRLSVHAVDRSRLHRLRPPPADFRQSDDGRPAGRVMSRQFSTGRSTLARSHVLSRSLRSSSGHAPCTQLLHTGRETGRPAV
jgi:hypothetical protein